jgi:hypothetical protein
MPTHGFCNRGIGMSCRPTRSVLRNWLPASHDSTISPLIQDWLWTFACKPFGRSLCFVVGMTFTAKSSLFNICVLDSREIERGETQMHLFRRIFSGFPGLPIINTIYHSQYLINEDYHTHNRSLIVLQRSSAWPRPWVLPNGRRLHRYLVPALVL